MAVALATFMIGWLARYYGASTGFLWAGAVEGAALVVLVLVRATRSRPSDASP